jgi:PEP-CTERM motif
MNSFLSKTILALAALITLSFAGQNVRADAFTFTGINTGVTGVVNITELSNNLLTVTITNTSTGSTSGKITSIGFDLPGSGSGGFTLVNTTDNKYVLVEQVDGSAAGIGRTFEIALLTGPNFNGGGNPNEGIVEGASATFSISGDFTGFSQQQIARGMFLRFQNVDGEGSDVAKSNCDPPGVPEPTTMVLLGTGLAGAAGAARRKRKAAAAAAKAEAENSTN